MKRILNVKTIKYIGKLVKICGWVNTIRTHGKIVFIDIRDSSGLIQIVFTPSNEISYELAQILRPEWVIEIEGAIKERPKGMQNLKIETGKIELEVKKLKILNKSKTLPFEISTDAKEMSDETSPLLLRRASFRSACANEELRLKYRYLDLRTERMKKNLVLRYKIIKYIRDFMDKNGFIEIQTPLLTKSTPEGARNFVIPSRLHPGKFYTLPQSPQQYKQLLMIAGFEKYFQIAPCFRDEAARADRSPGEFYQLDIEMSFITQEDILNLVEELFISLVKELFPDKKITKIPWPRLSHKQTMEKYQTDKPDLRKNKKDKKELAFCWILDFPLFAKQTKQNFFHGAGEKMAPSHHMFTAPKEEDIKLLAQEPLKVKSMQHDLVLNGIEIGGGSIRIHNPKIQEKIFELIGFKEKEKKQFSHLLSAFEYGCPPHGGIAPGIDRLVRILLEEDNIREVTAFPMSGDAKDLMMGTPAEISKEQLKELHIQVNQKNEPRVRCPWRQKK